MPSDISLFLLFAYKATNPGVPKTANANVIMAGQQTSSNLSSPFGTPDDELRSKPKNEEADDEQLSAAPFDTKGKLNIQLLGTKETAVGCEALDEFLTPALKETIERKIVAAVHFLTGWGPENPPSPMTIDIKSKMTSATTAVVTKQVTTAIKSISKSASLATSRNFPKNFWLGVDMFNSQWMVVVGRIDSQAQIEQILDADLSMAIVGIWVFDPYSPKKNAVRTSILMAMYMTIFAKSSIGMIELARIEQLVRAHALASLFASDEYLPWMETLLVFLTLHFRLGAWVWDPKRSIFTETRGIPIHDVITNALCSAANVSKNFSNAAFQVYYQRIKDLALTKRDGEPLPKLDDIPVYMRQKTQAIKNEVPANKRQKTDDNDYWGNRGKTGGGKNKGGYKKDKWGKSWSGGKNGKDWWKDDQKSDPESPPKTGSVSSTQTPEIKEPDVDQSGYYVSKAPKDTGFLKNPLDWTCHAATIETLMASQEKLHGWCPDGAACLQVLSRNGCRSKHLRAVYEFYTEFAAEFLKKEPFKQGFKNALVEFNKLELQHIKAFKQNHEKKYQQIERELKHISEKPGNAQKAAKALLEAAAK